MIKPLKLYMAGPMSGIPQFNFPAFLEAGNILRRKGYDILSPAEMDLEEIGDVAMKSDDGKLSDAGTVAGHTFGDFLARDVKIVADKVDGVVCLPGWEGSKGARLEVYCALISDKPVYQYVPETESICELAFSYCANVCMARRSYNQKYLKVAYDDSTSNVA